MKKCTIKISILLAITIGLINSSCSSDEWDRHYNNTDVVLINESLSDIIKNETDLTIFSRLMEISGYDTILSSSQTFTVWAPLDSDPGWIAETSSYLDESDVDTSKIIKLIGNHISRFSYPTAGLDSQRLYMLCKKNAEFKLIANQAFLGDVALEQESNIPAKNGLLHKISGFNPYVPGHWEFLTEYPQTASLDSLKSYMNSLIIEDDYGVEINNLFKDYAKLDDDDSTYTFIALTNNAWKNALAQAMSYHNVYDITGMKYRLQYQYSKKAIFSDLIFNKVADPTGLDSITSTSKTVFKDVNNLIAGATKYRLSNGSMFITDSLRMKPIESYFKRIVVEAESNIYGRSNSQSDLYSRIYYGTKYSISDKKYTYVSYNGSGDTYASITMNIPDVLSGKYKLYVVTVPHAIDNPSVPMGMKFRVIVNYRKANGTIPKLSVKPAYESHKKAGNNGFIASATEVEKVYVDEFEFPFCSMYEKGKPMSLDVLVMIESRAVKNDERLTTKPMPLTRDLRIDCIILEPVE